MRLRDTVQSKWLKVEDLPGKQNGFLDLTIAKVGMSKFSDGRESVDLYFHEHPKPLGANATNRKRLMMLFGEDIELEDLRGRRIRVYAEMTQDAKGVACWGVRIGPVSETVSAASAEARERIAAAQARTAAAAPARPRTMPQDARGDHPRPMSHRETLAPAALNGPSEPAGFVDPQDPGAGYDDGDPFAEQGGRW